YPVTLEKSGLISALREMAITVENSYGTKCRVYNQGNDTAPDVHTSYQLYYIVQEAINNAIRHGRAKKIDIDIVIKKKLIRFVVVNDITVKNRKKKSDGMGLRIMAYRAEMIGGTFSVKSTKKTFRVEVEIKYQ
ncbi:MAG TPA: hypothetical protein P5346_15150, partial [Spirochaetota bacterium]|nr:hypothetical protein [Spirochaetota bacterium]